MIIPGKQSSEEMAVMIGLAISACWILCLDVEPVIAIFISKEVADLAGSIGQAHPRGEWPALAAMWGGISVFTLCRMYLKTKFPVATDSK